MRVFSAGFVLELCTGPCCGMTRIMEISRLAGYVIECNREEEKKKAWVREMYREKGREHFTFIPPFFFLSGLRSEKVQTGFDILSFFVVEGKHWLQEFMHFQSPSQRVSACFGIYSHLTSGRELSFKISSSEDNLSSPLSEFICTAPDFWFQVTHKVKSWLASTGILNWNAHKNV